MITPPKSEQELMQRARALAGMTLAELADQLSCPVPDNLRREKGWQGQLLELALGASALTKPEPDFQDLGIELKSLPINEKGKPRESTFISTVPLMEVGHLTWKTSFVYRKLAKVLWCPIIIKPNTPIAERILATPFLWSPTEEQERILAQDWQELTDKISMGALEEITAHHGQYLQIRPKAANGRSLCKGIGPDGSPLLTLPRGFYLRASFTHVLLKSAFINF